MERPLRTVDVGVMRYAEGLALQKSLVAAKKAGEEADFLILVEHPPVVTLGRTADEKHLLMSREALLARGVDVAEIERGGDVTYHGPGQLVGYPIIDLKRKSLGIDAYLRAIERALIDALAEHYISAYTRQGLTGVWADEGKLAAIGIAVTRWISYHGFALNVTVDPKKFDIIVPCGLAAEKVASMQSILGHAVEMGTVKGAVARTLGVSLGSDVETAAPEMIARLTGTNGT